MPGGQGQTGHPELRPQCVEDRRSGGCEPARSLARSRQGQDRVEAAGPLSRRRPRLFGAAAGIAEGLQSELAAPRNLRLAQPGTQQSFVTIELGHVIAQTLEGPENGLALVAFGAFARQFGLADHCTGGREAVGGRFEHGPAFRLRLVPMRAAAQAEPRRGLRHRRRHVGDRHHRRPEQRDVADRARHDADRVEGFGVDPHAGRRKQPKARLEPDNAAIGRRPDHRAAGLRADRERHHEVGDRRRRAAGRPARRKAGVVRVRRRAGMSIGELGRHRLAEQDAAGRARQRSGAGVVSRPAADIDRRAIGRRHVGAVEDVLEAERHPVQQSLFARSVALARLGQRRFARKMAPCAHHRLALGDPRETALDHRLCGQLAVFDQANQGRRGKAVWLDIWHGADPRRPVSNRLSTHIRG